MYVYICIYVGGTCLDCLCFHVDIYVPALYVSPLHCGDVVGVR